MNKKANTILYKKNSVLGDLLKPAYPGDAGMDVVVSNECLLLPGIVSKVELGISIAVPDNYAFTFLTRSSAVAKNLFVIPTLIDSGYRGPLYLFVLNLNHFSVRVYPKDRLAQMVLIDNHAPVNIKLVEELPKSDRGSNGFGSSGGAV